jgi:hypothetical protein
MSLNVTATAVLVSVTMLFCANAASSPSVLTYSLEFHLQNLGRKPTVEEREIIEVSLRLMQLHQIRGDYPLKSINYDTAKKEWILDFDGSHPKPNMFVSDSQFSLFLKDRNATDVEIHWAGTDWRTRYPPKRKTR